MDKENGSQHEVSIEALKAGDRAEFARFVEEYSPAIYRLGLRMLNNEQDAEDILQDTFIKAFQHIQEFEGRSRLSTWLYRIATNEALMLLRKRRPDTISVEEPVDNDEDVMHEPLQILDWTNLPEDELLSAETRAYMKQAVEKLPDSLRITFILREIENLSTLETAQVLNISETAVKTRLSRARLKLREELSSYYEERVKGNVYGAQ